MPETSPAQMPSDTELDSKACTVGILAKWFSYHLQQWHNNYPTIRTGNNQLAGLPLPDWLSPRPETRLTGNAPWRIRPGGEWLSTRCLCVCLCVNSRRGGKAEAFYFGMFFKVTCASSLCSNMCESSSALSVWVCGRPCRWEWLMHFLITILHPSISL